MNCEQAKKIKIVDFLSNMGKQPSRVYGDFAWYNSPVRTDNKPSFKVKLSDNMWFDVSTGSGGNILDLVMLMNSTNVAGALMILQRPELAKQSFSFSEKQNSPGIEIKHIQPLQNRALIEYLNHRGIPSSIGKRYLYEAYYNTYPGQNKSFFALAFKNDKGGFELRSSHFKGCNSPKYITTIPGRDSAINVFEGFMDFLSALAYYRTNKPANKTIVLNTVENLKYAELVIKAASRVNLFLDNDAAGSSATEKIRMLNPNTTDYREIIYPNNKDFNEYLNSKNYENNRKSIE